MVDLIQNISGNITLLLGGLLVVLFFFCLYEKLRWIWFGLTFLFWILFTGFHVGVNYAVQPDDDITFGTTF